MTSRSLLSAGLFLGWCAVLLNGCGDDITADDDDTMGGGGSTNGGSNARGGMGGTNAGGMNGGSTVGGASGGSTVGGTSGGPAGGTTGGITFEPAGAGGMGGDGGAAEGGDGGMPPIGQAGSSGDAGGGGMAGQGPGPGAAGGGGDWSMAGAPAEGGADDGMAGAGGGGAEPARTCSDGCAELFYPETATATAREWDLALGAATDLSASAISVRLRVEGGAGAVIIYAKSPPAWGYAGAWNALTGVPRGTWVTITLDLTLPQGNVIRSEVAHIGVRYEASVGAPAVRFEVDSITISNATVGPWDFTTSVSPLALGWTPEPTPGTISWIQPEN